MNKAGTIIVAIISVILIGAIIFFGFTPGGRSVWNSYTHSLEKADENQYETKKQVEDTARSMIASYKSDVATYEQYKDSDNEEKQSWAEQAKMRACNFNFQSGCFSSCKYLFTLMPCPHNMIWRR